MSGFNVSVVAAFLTSLLLAAVLSRVGHALNILDVPNERSLHAEPVPRTGGFAILGGLLAGLVPVFYVNTLDTPAMLLISAVALVAFVSFLDDKHSLPAGFRLLVHLLAAGMVMMVINPTIFQFLPSVVTRLPGVLAWIIMLLMLVWLLNLYNFMDGMDGFAGGMTLWGFGTFAVLGWQAEQWLYLQLNLLVAVAASGFLLFNFPPARIFLGDTGSSVLGLLAGISLLWGSSHGIFPFWIGILVFSPFIVDATLTLMRRLFKGEKVWIAHRTHYYQRLVRRGWGHRRTVLWEYALMILCAAGAMYANQADTTRQWLVFSLGILFYLGLWFRLHGYLRRGRTKL